MCKIFTDESRKISRVSLNRPRIICFYFGFFILSLNILVTEAGNGWNFRWKELIASILLDRNQLTAVYIFFVPKKNWLFVRVTHRGVLDTGGRDSNTSSSHVLVFLFWIVFCSFNWNFICFDVIENVRLHYTWLLESGAMSGCVRVHVDGGWLTLGQISLMIYFRLSFIKWFSLNFEPFRRISKSIKANVCEMNRHSHTDTQFRHEPERTRMSYLYIELRPVCNLLSHLLVITIFMWKRKMFIRW